MKRILIALILVLFLSIDTSAQETLKYSVTSVVEANENAELVSHVANEMDAILKALGAERSYNEGLVFLIDAKELENESDTIISISVLSRLPEKIVNMGGRGQVFYSAIQNNGIQIVSDGGDQLREEITKDYLRQFMQIVSTEILLVNKSNIRSELTTYFKTLDYLSSYKSE
jgi:hypothetical protein